MEGCPSPPPDPDYCFVQPCAWKDGKCAVRACLAKSESTCTGDCAWRTEGKTVPAGPVTTLVEFCRYDPCHSLHDSWSCSRNSACHFDYNTYTCTVGGCAAHKDDATCGADAKCQWDAHAPWDQPQCKEGPCANKAKSSCNANSACMFKGSNCVPKTCEKYNVPTPDMCACGRDTDCKWHHDATHPHCNDPKFSTCPDLDIAMVLDGSGSMRAQFGNHPHGFRGMMEMMRTWARQVPLTGDNHKSGKNAAKGTGQMRLTFIQFSIADATPAMDHPMNCAIGQCTDGMLSGRLDELEGDISWHEGHYQAGWTYIHAALQDVADHTFLPANSPPWRKHVVIIVADGGLTDFDGDACCDESVGCGTDRCKDTWTFKSTYPAMLTKAQTDLRNEGVVVYGVVIRKYQHHTAVDAAAEIKLKTLVSDPRDDHYVNVMLDDLVGTVLNTLCDPTSKFGKSLAAPKPGGGGATGCEPRTTEAECAKNPSCAWDATLSKKCHDNPCFGKCSEVECVANAQCEWNSRNGGTCVKKPPTCATKGETDCKNDPKCLWNPLWHTGCTDNVCKPHTSEGACKGQQVTMPAPCVAPVAQPDYCKMQVCAFDGSPKKCGVKKCLHTDGTTCKAESGCFWEPTNPLPAGPPSTLDRFCGPEICKEKTDCEKDWRCRLQDGTTCKKKVCYPFGKDACTKDPRCDWSTATSPARCNDKECMQHDTTAKCSAATGCMWIPSPAGCIPATPAPPTPAPPTDSPPTDVPPTAVPPTNAPPTNAPPTNAPPTNVPPTNAPPTNAPPTNAPPTDVPPTNAPPTNAPPTPMPPIPDVDECLTKSKADVCKAAGQTCVDSEQKVDDSFECRCPPPFTQSAKGKAAACEHDECQEKSGVCTAAGQECKDTKRGTLNDWTCVCISPQTSPAPGQQQQAKCKDPPGDCEVHGKLCHAEGQACVDGVPRDDNFECKCLDPSTGVNGHNAAANCTLDECTKVCPSCAQTSAGGKNVCTGAGQTCEDANHSPQSLKDWKCVCASPYTGQKAIAVASCEINECHAKCPHCADTGSGNACEKVGQACLDKDVTTNNDWECHCVSPKSGTAVKGPATCTENECSTHETVCVKAGQTCVDPTTDKSGDWTCVCKAPSKTVGQQAAAECKTDECDIPAVAEVCTAVGQECYDPDQSKAGTWKCKCKAPATGVAVGAAVTTCVLDECAAKCPTCANSDGKGNVCELNGQTCEDPHKTASSTNDWTCTCPNKVQHAVGAAVPVCDTHKDECAGPSTAVKECVHKPRYTETGCLCKCGWKAQFTCTGGAGCKSNATGPGVDAPCAAGCCNPNHSADGDWCYVDGSDDYNKKKGDTCKTGVHGTCSGAGQVPADGGKKLRAPIPGVPADQNNVCTDAGQKCVDPDVAVDGNWQCECVLPKSGPRGNQTAAACVTDECTEHGATCTAAGQECVDTDKDKPDTWECRCKVGPANPKVKGVAVCELDECKEVCPTCAMEKGQDVCAKSGQTCSDPNNSTKSLGDWTCTCAAPATGVAVGAPASCVLDECEVSCPHCADKGTGKNICKEQGQTCSDPNNSTGSTGDWTCACPPPFPDVQTASAAKCELDECIKNKATCTAGQKCVDVNLKKVGDWLCECQAPSTGSQVGGAAKCKHDECAEKAALCTAKGQHCVDPDHGRANDWICECISPDVGAPGQQAPSTDCQPVDACKDKAAICTAKQQHCKPGAPGKFTCECIAPATGTPVVGGVAVCETDECNVVCATCQQPTEKAAPTCLAAGQSCVDPDKKVASNWKCECRAPTTGAAATLKTAECELDECEIKTCATCAKTTCSAAGQKCVEGSKDPRSTADWHCVCPPPSNNTARASAAVSCTYDECSDPAVSAKCTGASPAQICLDPNTTTTGNWECHCTPPYSGTKTGAPADGCDVLNECTVTCAHCANTGGGNVCQGQNQKCVDPDHKTNSDWYCECLVGTGVKVGGVVTKCELDECTATCPTCADKGGGNICTKEGQTCVDPTRGVHNVSDWKCVCPPPLDFVSANAALAVCGVDECKEKVNGTVPGALCKAGGQLCTDANKGTLGDFVCQCPPPSLGSHTGALAKCTTDECKVNGNEICGNATQTCLDPNTTKANDWVCKCPPPSVSVAVGQAAVCEVDECLEHGHVCDTAKPQQDCVDPDKTTAGDWECRCRTPSTGTAKGAAAVCSLDECKEDCATCSHGKCTKVGQTCTDPNPTYGSLSDWVCKCPPPSKGKAVGNAAECSRDECKEHEGTCLAKGQKCVDPNDAAASTGDWECLCHPPKVGRGVAGAAECTLDECKEHGHECTDVGQTCHDANKAASSTGDWACRCVAPSVGADVATKPAKCRLVGECEDDKISSVCTSKGQTCVDPNKKVKGDWECACVAPSVGKPAVGKPATCKLNECTTVCATCAGTTCSGANQNCLDTNQDPVSGLNSWECVCIAPKVGSKVGAQAACKVDECDVHGSTCTGAGQDCFDPDDTASGDWMCKCRAPAVGQATGKDAHCETDECKTHEKTCTDKGQTCFDPDHGSKSLNDWECNCVAPSEGKQTAAPVAACKLDECKIHGEVCAAVGQTCVDEELTGHGWWKCFCPPPNQKRSGDKGPAVCNIDECKVVGNTTALPKKGGQNVCEAKNQTCTDPNVSPDSLSDWTCSCPAPSVSVAVGSVAVCEYDECTSNATSAVCTKAGQKCVDPSWTKAGDWECRCVAPGEGKATAKAAVCKTDECKDHGAICAAHQQECVDPSDTVGGSWECRCPANGPTKGKNTTGPADCTPPAESECKIPAVSDVCTKAGQVCVDPTPYATKNNWLCECVAPAKGANKAGAPTECKIDECKDTCATCAGATCAAAGQTCNDPNTAADSLSDWTCTCVAPRTGSAKAAAATCQLEECTAVCASCADHGAGHACQVHGQTCVDPNTDARSTSDWMCVCKEPAKGNATTGVARCVIDECAADPTVCGEGQTCSDPNQLASSLGDWKCTCVLPSTGHALATKAHCVLDECLQLTRDEENRLTCVAAGQTCVDPTPVPGKLGDWECRCPTGVVKATAAAAKCELDECKDICPTCANAGGGNVCEKAGQKCNDPNKGPSQTGDWTCTCPAGAPAAVGNVAKCLLDECKELGNFAAHTCEDEKSYSADGCECACGWKADGSFVTASASGPGWSTPCFAGCCNPDTSASGAWCMPANTTANVAKGCLKSMKMTCATKNETKAAPAVNVCTKKGQVCVDEDKAANSQADWKCQCVAPKSGEAVLRGVATCTENECEKHGQTCSAKGQTCVDPSGTTAGDWFCECILPATGKQVAGAATCLYKGECTNHSSVCTAVGQKCVDPSELVLGDWMCECVAPAKGISVKGAAAVCELDECTAKCATCADKGFGNVCKKEGQTCVEGSSSPSSVEDWKCQCPEGQAGHKTAGVAVCRQDECKMDGGRLAAVCGTAGQTCTDPNTLVKEGGGDWMCVCAAPSQGKATGKAATCTYSECSDKKKSDVCTKAGQACIDTNLEGLGDWQCQCMEADKSTGVKKTGKQAPADCSVPPSSWCVQNGKKCTEQGQACITAKNPSDEGSCACIAPLVGTPQAGAPATCELDECKVVCLSCADSGAGDVCKAAGQTCVEGSKDPKKGLHDWRCKCPNSTISTVAGVAKCTVNECDTVGTVVCTKGQQQCVDPDTDPESTDDWFCKCFDPAVGKKLKGVATCVLDECLVNAQTCSAAGQTCQDPNQSSGSMGDWVCNCPAPSVGQSVASAAKCKFVGDCEKEAVSSVCTAKGQTCVDPDVKVAGDWMCECVAPQVGPSANQTAATCTLDECTAVCATCAQKPGSQTHVCTAAEQSCVDTNKGTGSTGDWKCVCAKPGKGEQMGAAATCEVNECLNEGNHNICAAVKNAAGQSVQTCEDPDKKVRGDWKCKCNWPYTGTAGKHSAAKCILDECEAPKDWLGKDNGNKVCGAAGQTCLDPQQEVGSLGTWVCQCPYNSKVKLGMPVAAADCKPPAGSKCAQYGSACPKGQQCVEKKDKWYCLCQAPAEGEKLEGAATCELDECKARCETCAQRGSVHVCAVAKQACVDKDKSVDHLSDWSCECEVGQGHAQGKAAVCEIDECVANKGVCEAASQVCADPNKEASHTGDWTCTCATPASGFAVAGVADCDLDECRDHGSKCASKGQTCVDQNTAPTSQGDWVCRCPPPSTGQMTGGVATCKYTGGCDLEDNRKVCMSVGQNCVPGANATWSCACQAPARGPAGSAKAAVCKINECEEICPTCARTTVAGPNVCTAAKQTCYDPNKSDRSLGDWVCECPAPSTAAALAKAVEKCVEDECVTVSQHGAVKCAHFQRFTKEGCQCACPWRVEVTGTPPGAFSGPGFSEDCVSGCCNPNKEATGDWCMLADSDWNRKKGATCKPRSKQTCADKHLPAPTGAPAVVRPAGLGADDVLNVCTAVGQVCVDKNTQPTSQGDWVCECPNSDVSAALKPATCDVDECLDVTVCSAAGQQCVDPDKSAKALKNWECRCIEHEGTKVGGVAVCKYKGEDECKDHKETCHAAGQSCYDRDTTRKGDWECRCTQPSVGAPVTAGVATCKLDECSAHCPTCADQGKGHHKCIDAGQQCEDPNASPTSLSDWKCVCKAPSVGKAVKAVATCVYDECTVPANGKVCTDAGQTCLDRKTTADKTNDWVCLCKDKDAVGEGSMAAAVCVVDECLDKANAAVCQKAGQTCFDPTPRATGRNDWTCRCPLPSTGSAVKGVATCVFKGECDVAKNALVCTAAGQTCVDPNVVKDNDWMCICVAPETGHPGLMEKGLCGLDECKATCPTCEAGVCDKAGQLCHDPDVKKNADWQCACKPPMVGEVGVGKAAAVCRGKTCADLAHDKCDTDDSCEWDKALKCIDKRTPSPPVWTIKCVLYDDAAKCSKDPFCKWTGSACENECSAITNSTKCDEADKCRWDAVKKCTPDRTPAPPSWTLRCVLYKDKDLCKADPHCASNGANCTSVCEQKTAQAPCNATAECTWNEAQKCVSTREPPGPRFVHKCVLFEKEASCVNDPHCSWSENRRCVPSCWANGEEAACAANTQCEWSKADKACTTRRTSPPGYSMNCTTHATAPSCEADGFCYWHGEASKCVSAKCDMKTEVTCEEDRYCRWNKALSSCALKCVSIKGRARCEQAEHCMYDPKERCVDKYIPPPGKQCVATAQSPCLSDKRCDWNEKDKKCHVMTCTGYKADERPRCEEDKRCLWAKDLSKCYWRCESVVGEKDCAADARCTWSQDESRCHWKQCAAHESESRCSAVPAERCEWAAADKTCRSQCTVADTSAKCGLLDYCVWDEAEKCIAKKDEPPYSLCPRLPELSACNVTTGCTWVDDKCQFVTGAPDQRGAPPSDGDDDDCWWCWLLLALLLLCCSCFLLAFLMMRRRKQQMAQDDDKWNQHFEAKLDENEMGDLDDDGEMEQSLLQTQDSPHSKSVSQAPVSEDDL